MTGTGDGRVVRADVDDGRLLLVLGPTAGRMLAAVCAAARGRLRADGQAVGWLDDLVAAGTRPQFGHGSDIDTPCVAGAAVDALVSGGPSGAMDVTAAAAVLGLSDRQVRRLRAVGVLRSAGRGRVLAVDVEQLLARRSGR